MNSNSSGHEVVIKVIGNYSYYTSRCLGEGVYGKVYQGTEKQTKQKVAIKKIDLATFTNDKYLQNAIFSQIYLLKRFSHTNIVKFKDVLSSKNSLYIITEFCKNGDLKEVLKKKRFKEQEAFQVMKQILSGFSELVRQRIVHRDLKPANILINQGVYKIGDFGFAKYVDNFGTQMLKSCVGSPIYMAPQILQRAPYTTKCDIWSIGIIYYEMIHASPPWKAKDQPQLLKAIKNISISHILRKSTLGHKATQFLKRTLAYSEQQRIGWAQLFQNYGPRSDKHHESTEKNKASTKQKQRVVSANSSSHLSNQYGSGKITPLTSFTPINSPSNSLNSFATLNSPSISPERKRNLFPPSSQNHSNSNTRSQSTEQKKQPGQIDSVAKWRQFLVFYHYNCVECLINFNSFTNYMGCKVEVYARFLLSLSLLIKNRSTYSLSMISAHSRTHKNAEQLLKIMKVEHESYQMAYNDILMILQKLGLYKMLKTELSTVVGHGQVINEQRIQKMEGYMIQNGIQNIRNIVQVIKSKQKDRKSINNLTSISPSINREWSQIALVMENILQILQFGINRQKNKNAQEIIEEINNQNTNNGNGNGNGNSSTRNRYDYNSQGNISFKNERKLSQEYKQLGLVTANSENNNNLREIAKQWGDGFTRDAFGVQVVTKYDKVMRMLGRNGGNGGSLGNIGNTNI